MGEGGREERGRGGGRREEDGAESEGEQCSGMRGEKRGKGREVGVM